MPASSRTFSTPMWAKPRGPPEPSTSATRGEGPVGCTKCGSRSGATSGGLAHPASDREAGDKRSGDACHQSQFFRMRSLASSIFCARSASSTYTRSPLSLIEKIGTCCW